MSRKKKWPWWVSSSVIVEHHLDDGRTRVLIGGDQARDEVDALDDGREALEHRPLDDRVRADGDLAGLLEEAVERAVLGVGVGHRAP